MLVRPVLAGKRAAGVHFTGGGQVSPGGCVVAEAARGRGAGTGHPAASAGGGTGNVQRLGASGWGVGTWPGL